MDKSVLTAELEVISEEVQRRRQVDQTLARFSAVHDELAQEEKARLSRRQKFMPWLTAEDADEPPPPEEADPEADFSPEQLEHRRRKRELLGLAAKIVAIAIAAMVLIVCGIAWGAMRQWDGKIKQVDALDMNSSAIHNADKQQSDENFLLVGSDTRVGATADEHVGTTEDADGARSDTVMVAHVPADRKRIVIVSFPRDLEVSRPACDNWDFRTGQYTGGQAPAADNVKLNTAYGVGGPKCVTKLIQQLSGLRINHFLSVDFQGFKSMVDAVGPIEVCVEHPLIDDVLGPVLPKAGPQAISGDTALNFVRARHVHGDVTSDYGRMQRQQRFLSSLLRKTLSAQVLLDPTKLNNFIDAVAKSTQGENISIDQLVPLAQSLQGIDAGHVTFVTLPTVGTANARGNEVERVDDTKALFDAIIDGTPLPGESPSQAAKTPELVDPKTFKVHVLNGGNQREHIAANTADALHQQGFQPVLVSATSKVDQTIIKYAPGHDAQANTVAAAIAGAKLVADQSMGGAIAVVLGPEFTGTVTKATTGGAAAPSRALPSNLSTVNAADSSCR